MSEEKIEFKKGDHVSAFGIGGIVVRRWKNRVIVKLYGVSREEVFYLDGKKELWHLEPSLKLIEKAKKKMKIEAWANVYFNNATGKYETKGGFFHTLQNAIDGGLHHRIKSVRLISEEEFEI